MSNGPNRREFLQGMAFLSTSGLLPIASCRADHPSLFPSLDTIGNQFRVAIIADTQVGPADAKGVVPATSQRKMSMIVDEINSMNPAPAFVLFNGDQVENVEKRKVDNFLARAQKLKPLAILVHGNHDGHHPYAEFQAMQKTLNGTDGIYFSWNVGHWHFATIPTNIPSEDYGKEVLDWLEQDLLAHHDRPTILFPHYHLMPQGLSQLEWYTYDRSFRLRCYEILQRAGNVRYAIGGHVHNGIQTSFKTAWSYHGTNYLVAPTCTASRNFGEDFSQFSLGLPQGPQDSGGGYYLLLDFDGKEVTLRGRLVGVPEEFVFPPKFKEYVDQEPLWLADLTSLPIHPTLANGSFKDGLTNWNRPYRYVADRDPGFITRPESPEGAGDQSVYLACREKGQHWARDEETEIYQRTTLPTSERSALSFRFRPGSETKSGGGYVRLTLFQKRSTVMTILIDWLQGKKDRNTRIGINSQYTATGKRGIPDELIRLGNQRQAMFWTLPALADRWHTCEVDLPSAINRALGDNEAWSKLAVDEILLAAGVWCLEDPGSQASTWFDDFIWKEPSQSSALWNDESLPIDQRVFTTDFGRETLQQRIEEKKKRRPSLTQKSGPSPGADS
jgi:hypothetical protein